MIPYVNSTVSMSAEDQRKAIDRIRRSLQGNGKPKILLIEDDENDAFIFLKIFREMGVGDITWVKDIQTAISHLDAQSFKVIFLDLLLKPENHWRDLFAFCKLKKLNCQVIVLTGAYSSEDKECIDALKIGASAVMLKPLTVENARLIFSTP